MFHGQKIKQKGIIRIGIGDINAIFAFMWAGNNILGGCKCIIKFE